MCFMTCQKNCALAASLLGGALLSIVVLFKTEHTLMGGASHTYCSRLIVIDVSFYRTRDATFDTREGSVHMHLRGKPIQLFASSNDLKNSYSLNNGAAGALPGQDLKLEWVYGYRGKDARSNLYLLPTGELVYFIASVVVLFNPELNKQRHYLGHTEEVKW